MMLVSTTSPDYFRERCHLSEAVSAVQVRVVVKQICHLITIVNLGS